MKKVYLAGPITGLSYGGATDWRVEVSKSLRHRYSIESLNPMRAKKHLAGIDKLEAQYLTHPLSTAKGITTRDRQDVRESGVVLMNLLGAAIVSIGSMIEVGWCDAYRTPLVLVIEEKGNVHDHGMVTEIAGFRTDTLDSGIFMCAAVLGAV